MDWLEYSPTFLPKFLTREINVRCAEINLASFLMAAVIGVYCIIAMAILFLVRFNHVPAVCPVHTVKHVSQRFPETIDEGWEITNKHYAQGRAE